MSDRREHGSGRAGVQVTQLRTAGGRVARELADAGAFPDEHAEAVADLARRIGEFLQLSPERLAALIAGALVHDIGKLDLDERILLKPGPLDDEEWEEVRRHPDDGAELAGRVFSHEVVSIVRSHHERWDGRGYPEALAGERIPLGARVVAVADAFRAMIEPRPYRSQVDKTQAVDELQRAAGSQFDPACVGALLAVLDVSASAA